MAADDVTTWAPLGWEPSDPGFDDAPFGSVLGDPLTGSLMFDVSVLDEPVSAPGSQGDGVADGRGSAGQQGARGASTAGRTRGAAGVAGVAGVAGRSRGSSRSGRQTSAAAYGQVRAGSGVPSQPYGILPDSGATGYGGVPGRPGWGQGAPDGPTGRGAGPTGRGQGAPAREAGGGMQGYGPGQAPLTVPPGGYLAPQRTGGGVAPYGTGPAAPQQGQGRPVGLPPGAPARQSAQGIRPGSFILWGALILLYILVSIFT